VSEPRVPSPHQGTAGLPLSLEVLEARLTEHFDGLSFDLQHGELTVFAQPAQLVELLIFCRDDEQLSCEMLSDLAGVHWPAGDHVVERQVSTTGWPEYRVSRERGVIEVDYILRSITRNHRLRVSVGTDDTDPRLPSVVGVYPTANYHEREVYDFFGVEFEGHPNLQRILMPDDWLGHPHRKDYPLGGVDVPYKNDKFIPPPDERDLREVVE
jgi:NADH-quinone oxidoreductase subunit C